MPKKSKTTSSTDVARNVSPTAKAESKEVAETVSFDAKLPTLKEDNSFEAFLPLIKAGKEVTLADEPGVYFKWVEPRLLKYSNNGGYIDQYPLHGFQQRKGWALRGGKKNA